ncbi:MAG TPA: cellulase family glycosylhydrolase [Candidatus Moranbacteria bacterium]|nr:cellulase family glycosylhydrolase [Candidatus Moranbacteria bacterium]
MKWIRKGIKFIIWTTVIIFILVIALFIYFNIPVRDQNDRAKLGVTFSYRYAGDIGLNWKETYLAMLDDLKIKKVRLPVYWDLSEKKEGQFDFSDIDWQLQEARKRNVEIILTIGQKVPRWPECAIPAWAAISDQKRKESLLKFISIVMERYKNNPEIKYWQIENEPFLIFGICPKPDADLLDREILLAKKIDNTKKIIVSDSGELSVWVRAARRADVFGTTMYRNIYKDGWGYYTYPIGPRFFRFKYGLISLFAEQKNAIVAELQAEPWIAGWTTNASLEEQFKSMNEEKLRENVIYAKQVGFPEIYLWGVEWWYWLKVQKNYPAIWNTARELFNQQ